MLKQSASGKQKLAFLALILIIHAELVSFPLHGGLFDSRTVTTKVPIKRHE